nr:Uma2 family endonuclease [Nocardia amikacinitolerans]
MPELFDWSSPKTYILPVDMDDYLAMPEEMSRTVEIKDGMIVHRESPEPNHNAIARNIERALLEGRAKRGSAGPCLRVNRGIDMLVSEVPLHYKRPDVIVYRCIEQPRPKWKMKPTVADTAGRRGRVADNHHRGPDRQTCRVRPLRHRELLDRPDGQQRRPRPVHRDADSELGRRVRLGWAPEPRE